MKVDSAATLLRPKAPCTLSRHGCCVKDDDLDVELSSSAFVAVLVGKHHPQSFGSACCYKASAASCRPLSDRLGQVVVFVCVSDTRMH